MKKGQGAFEWVNTSTLIFREGITLLNNQDFSEVRIYAPTGAWIADTEKEEWFWTIAYCLVNGLPQTERVKLKKSLDAKLRLNNLKRKAAVPSQKQLRITIPQSSLGMLKAVYGIPPTNHPGLDECLAYLSDLLAIFDGIPTAFLYYLETETDTIPGNGAILIDDNAFIGYAIHGRYKVDYGLFFTQDKDVSQAVRQWFDNHVLKELSQHNVIQDMDKGVHFADGIQKARDEANRKHETSQLGSRHKIFISYSHDDAGITEHLAKLLGHVYLRHNIWFDKSAEGLRGGDDWWQHITQQVSSCDILIFLVSTESLASSWCKKELLLARKQKKIIIPIQVRRTVKGIPSWLNKLEIINMSKGFIEVDTLNAVYASLLNATPR